MVWYGAGRQAPLCRCGGIGRHKGLKIPRGRLRTGSSPVSGTKKEVTFVYQKLLLFLSKPQAWYIITRQRAYHRRKAYIITEGVSSAA